VEDAERSEKLNDKKLTDNSDSMLRSPLKSLRKLAQEKDIGFATAHKPVRENLNIFPYKDARGHRFQHPLKAHSNFPKALYV
jgi:hypothetical protein